ncbi:MAG: dUTPase [Clostridiales bacterium]|nr:dUTPase [Clostridiales bacterium]
MDRLEHMLSIQKSLNDAIKDKRHLHDIDAQTWMQKYTLAMLSEMAELLDEVNFKWWKNEKPLNEPALKEELVDILHFFLSMCLAAGLDAEEMYRIYLKKNEENFARQEGRSNKPGYAVTP